MRWLVCAYRDVWICPNGNRNMYFKLAWILWSAARTWWDIRQHVRPKGLVQMWPWWVLHPPGPSTLSPRELPVWFLLFVKPRLPVGIHLRLVTRVAAGQWLDHVTWPCSKQFQPSSCFSSPSLFLPHPKSRTLVYISHIEHAFPSPVYMVCGQALLLPFLGASPSTLPSPSLRQSHSPISKEVVDQLQKLLGIYQLMLCV